MFSSFLQCLKTIYGWLLSLFPRTMPFNSCEWTVRPRDIFTLIFVSSFNLLLLLLLIFFLCIFYSILNVLLSKTVAQMAVLIAILTRLSVMFILFRFLIPPDTHSTSMRTHESLNWEQRLYQILWGWSLDLCAWLCGWTWNFWWMTTCNKWCAIECVLFWWW